MSRQLSYAHAYAVSTDCVFTLDMMFHGPEPWYIYRGRLQRNLANLEFVVTVFRETGWHADFPEFYLPIADAAISLREATHSHFFDVDGLECTRAYLEKILLIDPRKGGRKHVA